MNVRWTYMVNWLARRDHRIPEIPVSKIHRYKNLKGKTE
jgi:hypothetical protein